MKEKMSVLEQVSFTKLFDTLTRLPNDHREIRSSSITLQTIKLGVIYDQRLISGRHFLILQEKNKQEAIIAKKTVRLEVFANRFKAISYLTGNDLEEEIRQQLEDIDDQMAPLEHDRGKSYSKEVLDDLIVRKIEAHQRIGEVELDLSIKDLRDIHNGLNNLAGFLRSDRLANRNLSRFFLRISKKLEY
jgi:hypothetical protein